jgi:hypothetical protein
MQAGVSAQPNLKPFLDHTLDNTLEVEQASRVSIYGLESTKRCEMGLCLKHERDEGTRLGNLFQLQYSGGHRKWPRLGVRTNAVPGCAVDVELQGLVSIQ